MRESRGPFVISGIYFLFAFIWILLSDRFVAAAAPTAQILTSFQTYKGWVFIAATTILLLVVLRIYAQRKQRVVDQLEAAQTETRRSLREKEILINELHHRVKNNLQVVISMLRLDAAHATTDSVDTIRRRLVDRIFSIALVHETIYRSDAAEEVDVSAYIEELMRHIAGSHGRPEITVDIRTAPSRLHIDRAVPCGLALNEAVTNAYQHAFDQDRHGTIRVVFTEDEDTCRLSVEDDGRGFDTDRAAGTLGMTLMRNMAAQLGGELELASGTGGADSPGTRVTLRFPAKAE